MRDSEVEASSRGVHIHGKVASSRYTLSWNRLAPVAINYSFRPGHKGQSETHVSQGFSRADFGGFLAIHPLPSNSVPLLLEPLARRTKFDSGRRGISTAFREPPHFTLPLPATPHM
jgi:hypothetical protein